MSLSAISALFTEQTLDAIIRECGGIRHTAWRFGAGFTKGDSYLSEAFRLTIDGIRDEAHPTTTTTTTTIQVHIIVKSMPTNLARRRTFRCADFFRNECNFYRHVLAPMLTFQAERSVRAPVAFTEVPRLLYAHTDGTNDFIALEDLCPAGYASAPRQAGIDMEHCALIMRTLGKFHAVSLAIADQRPELLARICADASLGEVYYAEQYREWYSSFMRSEIAVARDAMRREYGGTEYERRATEFTDDRFYGRMCAMVSKRTAYSVIGHGDCWLPNFLLQYVDGRPREAKMIDFQLVRFGSPALDISFCVYSCTEQAMREAHYEELLQIYHRSACELLTALGSDAIKCYPMSALRDELRQAGAFGVGMGMESIPMSIKSEEDVPDLDTMEGEDAVPLADVWHIGPIEDAPCRRRLADTFRHAIDEGYL